MINEISEFTRIMFDPEPVSESAKLIKIKNGFLVDDERAKEILGYINSGRVLTMTLNEGADPYVYGIKYNSITIKDKERIKKIEEDRQKRWDHEAEVLKKANVWFDTLSKEEQEMITILGHYRFVSYAS